MFCVSGHAFCSSMLQRNRSKSQGFHQDSATESFQETASLFVQSCIEKFTSARQRAFRSLLVQVETRQMYNIGTGQSPVPIVEICPVSAADICPVSTWTSKDRKARWRALVNFSMQDCTKREAVSWKLSAVFFWWFLVILNVFVCNMLLQNACKNHRI